MEVQPNRRGRPTLVEKPVQTIVEQPDPQKNEADQEIDNLLQGLSKTNLESRVAPPEEKKEKVKGVDTQPSLFSDDTEVDNAVANFFSSEFRTAILHAKEYAFHVRTLDITHYLNGDIKMIDPSDFEGVDLEEGNPEVFMKYFSKVYEYFIYSLSKIENKKTKQILTVSQLATLPRENKDYFRSAAKTLAKVMGLELLMQVLLEYSKFFAQQDSELIQKKSPD